MTRVLICRLFRMPLFLQLSIVGPDVIRIIRRWTSLAWTYVMGVSVCSWNWLLAFSCRIFCARFFANILWNNCNDRSCIWLNCDMAIQQIIMKFTGLSKQIEACIFKSFGVRKWQYGEGGKFHQRCQIQATFPIGTHGFSYLDLTQTLALPRTVSKLIVVKIDLD